jgi:ABC-2 type transport system permease protein
MKMNAFTSGLVLPANFDNSLKAEDHPSLDLYVNGSTVNTQTGGLLQSTIIDYARTFANPSPPVTINTVEINPPSSTNTEDILGQVYTPLILLLSLPVGTSFILLLLEEKEKKTLRCLLVTLASFRDILIAKLLVVLFFQLIITRFVLAIQGGFTSALPLIIIYVVIGACFSLSLGLFFGSIFNTVSSAGAVSGIVSIISILGGNLWVRWVRS